MALGELFVEFVALLEAKFCLEFLVEAGRVNLTIMLSILMFQ